MMCGLNGKSINVIKDIIISLFVFVEIGTFLLNSSFMLRNILLLGIGVVGLICCLINNGIRNMPFVVFFLIYTIFGAISIAVNQNADIYELAYPLSYMSVGLLLLNFKSSFRLIQMIYYIVSVIFIACIVYAGGVDNLVMQSSRNNISVYELQLWTLYVISAYQNKQDIHIWSVLIGWLVCLFSIGRSGIITFSIILFCLICIKVKECKEMRYKNALGLVVVILGGALVCCFTDDIIMKMIDNFELRGLESVRTKIWEEYLIKVQESYTYVLFGAPQRYTFYLDMYANNLHNSFLQLHAKYGLAMVMIIFMMLEITIMEIYFRKEVYLLIPLIGIIFRMNFDYTNFNGVLDVVFVYYLLYPYYKTGMKCLSLKGNST
ncbi:MAG: hypothetical protein E7203_05560 [Selenomonas ruminantium]|jgi:DMSO reductase anchor subunit|uniref:O-antigen ligase n=1 Tax=Selenomonas ruminantium TaxID=971 RepID=A0A927WNV4_SELRU|nr:hypothetical protein [Selenomonas ruminantium]MBE6084924.1 hypothetical protein [Selenomonas ruminantium]